MKQLPIAFCGEFEVEDDAFECIVDRFIYRSEGVSFQFSCFDSEGGAHIATGVAQKDSMGRLVTSDFRVRYAADRTDTPASLRIESVEYDANVPTLTVSATWAQAGETFTLTGRLSKLKL